MSASPSESRRRFRRRRRRPSSSVTLGVVAENGVSPSMVGLLDRGIWRRPAVARSIGRGCVELHFDEDLAPIRVIFDGQSVHVEDICARTAEGRPAADLTIRGSLPHVIQLASAPTIAGVPTPTRAAGRLALRRLAAGDVLIEGRPLLARKLMRLLEI